MPQKSKLIVSLDIGGTKTMIGAFDQDGQLKAHLKETTPIPLEEGIKLIKKSIRQLVGTNEIIAIGASAGGPLDYKEGVLSGLHNPEWNEVPLKKILEEEFKCPFFVEVDTDAAALAEYYFGSHKNSQRLMYVTISTGVGGGFILDGKIYRGHKDSHPEVGHQSGNFILPKEQKAPCKCGSINCLEAIISGSGIETIYKKKADSLNPNEWKILGHNLGEGLRNIATMYAPEVIILGGGVTIGGGDYFIESAKETLSKTLKIVPVPEVSLSTLGYNTALWGGYAITLNK